MNKRFVRAALAACLLSSAAALAATIPLSPAFAASGPSVSAPVAKLMQPAEAAIKAGDNAGAMVLLKQAAALPDQTPFDTYAINSFMANAAIALKDYATAEVAVDAMAESSALPDADKASTLHNAALLAGQFKHYDKTIKYGQAYIALGGPPDGAVLGALATAYYNTNDYVNAAAFAQKSIAAAPAGQPPNEAALQIMFSSQWKSGAKADAQATQELLVSNYDDPDQWARLIDIAGSSPGVKDIDLLQIYRLRLATKAAGESDDYMTPAALAQSDHYPVEAEAYVNAGAGTIDTGKNGALISQIRAAAAKDRATLGQFESLANKTASGEFDVKLAETYMGYARYADAETVARRALTRPSPKIDHNEANMVLGEALILQGKTADAIAAFNAVSNPTPGMMQAKRVWLVYANRKTGAPTAAAH